MHRKVLTSYIHNVFSTRTNFANKIWLSMCLLVVLGSPGIVVKRIVAIFFLTVDCRLSNFINQLQMGRGGEGVIGCMILRHAMTSKKKGLSYTVGRFALYGCQFQDGCHLGGHLESFHASLNCQVCQLLRPEC